MLETKRADGKNDSPKSGHFFTAFWAWHDLTSFLLALAGFTLFWSIVTSILIKYTWYVEALGMVSLLVEATLGAPQLITIDILILLQVFFYRNNIPSDMPYESAAID
ncbi:hypothetical protein WR25_18996 [Diploscapter pachys]|uniref:Uncharacterized protein n=1 Tax=Diploscapter pachys TaxID=2018661 RepID=A0A2A2KFX3_9BILA|nr:hypothetical protein WR25_18996 [Diploscapter pachys]